MTIEEVVGKKRISIIRKYRKDDEDVAFLLAALAERDKEIEIYREKKSMLENDLAKLKEALRNQMQCVGELKMFLHNAKTEITRLNTLLEKARTYYRSHNAGSADWYEMWQIIKEIGETK